MSAGGSDTREGRVELQRAYADSLNRDRLASHGSDATSQPLSRRGRSQTLIRIAV